MAEKTFQYIPARLKNASIQGYVAGAEDIVDDRLGRNQQDINQDTYRKNEVYGKAETDEIISRTPETDVVVLAVAEGDTVLDTLNEVPLADRPNKLFRVKNDDNTAYSEYGWTGTVWALLAEKDYGIDDSPKTGSTNVITSGGVAKFIEGIVNPSISDVRFMISDKYGSPIVTIDDYSKFRFFMDIVASQIEAPAINGVSCATIYENSSDFRAALVDKYYNVAFAFDENFKIYSSLFNTNNLYKEDKGEETLSVTYRNNQDKDLILLNNSRYNMGNKAFQALVITDSHSNTPSFKNAIDSSVDFTSLDCLIHLGDYCYNPWTEMFVESMGIIGESKIPSYYAIGNHDIGIGNKCVSYVMFNDELYDLFVKPVVDKNFLDEGEYEEGKLYYYHDFTDTNTRIIVLFPFDDDEALDETYWEKVNYNSSYPMAAAGSFSVGNYINMPNYTKGSFKCVQDVTIGAKPSYAGSPEENLKWPCTKCVRPNIWFGQEQLEWLCETLDDAGEKGYNVVICSHLNIISKQFVQGESTIGYTTDTGTAFPAYLDRYETVEESEIISDIIDAFQSNTEKRVSMDITAYAGYNSGSGLEPKVYDDCSHLSISLDYTFQNSGKVVVINGHNHRDGVIRHASKPILGISLSADVIEYRIDKPSRSENYGSKGFDLFTGVTVDYENERLYLTRIGADLFPAFVNDDSGEHVNMINKLVKF